MIENSMLILDILRIPGKSWIVEWDKDKGAKLSIGRGKAYSTQSVDEEVVGILVRTHGLAEFWSQNRLGGGTTSLLTVPERRDEYERAFQTIFGEPAEGAAK